MNEEQRHLKNITKGAMIVFIGMFIGRFLGYITRIVMARFFGADAYGLFSLASAILGIATTISLLGIPQGMARFISFYIGKRDLKKIKGTITSGLKITLPVSIFVGIILFLIANDISIYFFNKPGLTPLVQLFALALPFSILLIILLSSFRGFQNMKYKVIVEDLSKPLSTLVLVLLFFFMGYGIFGAVVAYTIGYVASCILGFYLLSRLAPLFNRKLKGISMKGELFSFSWPLIISGYLWMIITWTDIMMLGFFRSSQEVGFYNVALPTAALILIVVDAFIYIFMPNISELYAKNKKEDIVHIHSSVVKWVFMISLSFFLVIAFFPDNILNVLFGQEYVAASLALVILATGYIFSIPGSLSGSGLAALGKTKIILMIVLFGSILNFIINLALIPYFGIIGAAVATATSFIAITYMYLFFGHKYLGLKLFNISYIKAFVSGGSSIVIFYFIIKSFYSSPPWWLLLGAFPFFLFLYGFLFLMMKGFDKNDIMILTSIEKKTGIRLGFVRKIVKRFL